jgi:bifunctional UDP-N-acetylglucosamine pyrophosphorylase/glucosamine-1-phosphate N-acetyltransferase
MRSRTPKLLHPLCGREMIGWPIAAARAAGAAKIVVVDSPARPLQQYVDADVEVAVQAQPHGTADALEAAAAHFELGVPVLVLYGDVPLIRPQTLTALAAAHAQAGAAATMLTATLDDPSGYGRVVRGADGQVERVVETKRPGDATPEQLEIHEVNTGIYAFDGGVLAGALAQVGDDNAQGERYLPDVLPVLRRDGRRVAALALGDPVEMFNVNDRRALAQACAVAQRRINDAHMLAGVTIVDPERTLIEVDVQLAADARIEPGCDLRGATVVAEGAVVGPHTTLVNSRVGAGANVIHSYVTGAEIGDEVNVGPFAYLRPGAVLDTGAKAGTFVEIKNSHVGARSKVPHLSYVGDTEIGVDTNLGAATITANYDGYVKNRTRIGARVHTGVDTTFVAPVSVGDDVYTAAGSVITGNVPDGALAIARERQVNREGYADRVRALHEQPVADDGEEGAGNGAGKTPGDADGGEGSDGGSSGGEGAAQR